MIPTLKQVVTFLEEQSTDMSLFGSIPIGTPALVCLECNDLGWTLQSYEDGEIDCEDGAWDHLYLGDSNAELRLIAHRLITTVRDRVGVQG